MRSLLGKTGWGLVIGAFVGWMAWGVSLGLAGEETFDASATTVTLTASDDTYIDSTAPTVSYGSGSSLAISESGSQRALLKWDLSSIPSGQAILAAHVKMGTAKNAGVDSTAVLGAYRVMKAWTENATWNTTDGSTSWTTAGAAASRVNSTSFFDSDTVSSTTSWDIQYMPEATIICKGRTGTTLQNPDTLFVDLTVPVRRWYSGQWQNNGTLIKVSPFSSTGWPAIGLYSSEYTTAALRPQLIVTYAPIGGGGAGGDTTVAIKIGRFGVIERGLSPQ